ncbi:MAG: hypothetical protein ACR2PY_04100 [Salinispira sp.]
MNRKIRKSALFVPFVYVCIIVFLVFFQFSGRNVFTEKFGQITLSGTLDISDGIENHPVVSVVVEYHGLRFVFDDKHSLIIEQSHNTNSPFPVSGYKQEDDKLVVYFEEDIELVFSHDQNQLIIASRIPETLNNSTTLRIPFILSAGSSAENAENFPGLYVDGGSEHYVLALPTGSYINREAQLINIPEDGFQKIIRYTRRAAGNTNASFLLFEGQLEDISPEQHMAEIQNYIDRAYLAWRSNRYNLPTGTWIMENDENRFSENILVSLLSEAWRRNEYTRVFNEMRSAADLHPSELTYRSSVFLGNLRKINSDLNAEERQTNIQINNMINQDNALVFLRPGLFQYIEDQSNNNLREDLLLFTESLLPDTLTALEALGLLMNYYLTPLPNNEFQQILSRFENLIEEKILPGIVRVNEGFFFLTESGIADSYYSVIAGQILIQAGESKQDERFITLGRNLILSIIRLGDQLAFVPAKIEVTAGTISATQGMLSPEEIYPFITDNSYYPQHISLSGIFGPGAWVYGVFSDYEITNNPGEFVLSFMNSQNRTHYIFFRGMPDIDPLTGMELFGIIWRNAPDFEIYSKGRYYNTNTGTLMIKFFDPESRQRIRIFY